MRNKNGLTDAEFEEAKGLSRALMAREGVNDFYSSCLVFAQSRQLSRRQLERLRYKIRRREDRPAAHIQSRVPAYNKSKRPISLARHA